MATPNKPIKPWLDTSDFNAGYLMDDSSDYDSEGEVDIATLSRELKRIDNLKVDNQSFNLGGPISKDEPKIYEVHDDEDENLGPVGAQQEHHENDSDNDVKNEENLNEKINQNQDGNAMECYEQDYFSSGEEGDDVDMTNASDKNDRRRLTNDELLYDPNMDDRDEKWVDDERRKHRPHAKKGPDGKPKPATPITTDAILSCPLCMSIVCLDCQQHDVFHTQFRAMFVTNCHVINDEILRHAPKNSKAKQEKGKLIADRPMDNEEYHPVRCDECNTEIGVYDKEEVYHFFNVLASEP